MAKSERCGICGSILLDGKCPTTEDHEGPVVIASGDDLAEFGKYRQDKVFQGIEEV